MKKYNKIIIFSMMVFLFSLISRSVLAQSELSVSLASASSYYSSYTASKAIDNSLSTYWRGAFFKAYWWLTLDLGKDYSLGQISIWWHKNYGSTNYNIQASTDGTTWTNLYTALSSAGGSTNPYKKDYTFSGTYHYIRIYINKANGYYPIIYEVKLYGSLSDSTAPATPQVTDDGATTTSGGQLHASWVSSDAESGISEYQYKITQDTVTGTTILDWTSTGTSSEVTKTGLSLTADKTYYFSVKAKNGAGLWSEAGYSDGIKVIAQDTVPPVTTDSGIDGLWHNASVIVTLTASDSSSGVDRTYYSTNGSTPSTLYTGPFTVANEGTYTIKYYSVDKAGNVEAIKTASNQVKIDKTPPNGTIKINNGSQYTTSTASTLELSAQDNTGGSGISQARFSNDGATWSTPETYVTNKNWTLTSSDGAKTVYVKYSDVAGNWSGPFSDSITLDTTPPVISLNPVISPTNQNVVLSYSVSDNFTPENEIIINGDNSPYAAEGVHNVTLTAGDLAGNSASAEVNFTIDKTPPVVVITSPQDGVVLEDPQVQLQGTIDGVAFSETRTLTEGKNTITKVATDAAGNTASVSVNVYLYSGQLIGPEGGEVSSPDGKVKVVIPQGALNQATRIKILSVSNKTLEGATPGNRSLLSAVECKPYGLNFNQLVSIVYTLYSAEVPGTPVELGLYDSEQGKIIPTGQATTVPSDGYSVEFSITHFSTYAALKNLIPQSAPIGSGVKIPLPDMLTGSFGHAFPLTIPPGRKGMQPALALTYRSSNPNSWIGQGFSLNPGYIVRSTRLGPPTYIDTQDTFYFITDAGTTELVNLIDNLYQAKVESGFTKFFKEPDDSWRAVAKDGSVLRFGTTSDSKEISFQGTFAWYLTKAVDTNGNYIEYQYIKDQDKSYLSRISYTGNEMGISPANYVEFILESRDDIFSSYISSSKIVTGKRLKEIQVKQNYGLVWRYVLEYEYSLDTNRSLLKSVAQYGSDNKNLPIQTLSYQSAK